jgi:23S rRNA pseudouridine1911/1915/1917 synthase
VVGDPVYGARRRLAAGVTAELNDCLRAFTRQALHAQRLHLLHPASGVELSFEAPLPADFQALLAALGRDHARSAA